MKKKLISRPENHKYQDEYGTEMFPYGKLFRISYDSTTDMMVLKCFNQNDLEKIIEVYSDNNPAYFYMKQYGYTVDKKISPINNFGYFQCGFIFEILKYVKLTYGTIDVIALSNGVKSYIMDFLTPLKRYLKENGIFEIDNVSEDSGRNKTRISEGKEPYIFRDYQKISIEKLLFSGYGRGILEVGTAGGKSFILGNFIYNIHKHINPDYRVLLLVPNKQLVYQMYNDFVDYGMEESQITKFSGGLKKNERYNPEAKIIIANRQYLFSNMDKIPKIDIMICDECHTTLASKTLNVINSINSKIRIGCTGSIPKTKYDRWQLNGIYGKIIYSKAIGELQKDGYVSNMKLYKISVTDTVVENDRNYLFHTRSYKKYSPDENGYSDITFNAAHDAEHEHYEKYYKELYTPVLQEITKYDGNTLFLFDKIIFGKRLFDLSNEIFDNKKIHYIDGSVDVRDRLEVIKQIEDNDNNILFAENATFSTGINAKRLKNLVFISSSKSFPFILQAIGRTLRLHSSKKEARIFDISFNFKYSQRHLEERLKIYKSVYNKVPDKTIYLSV